MTAGTSTGKLQRWWQESSEGLFTHVAGGWCWLLVGNLAGAIGWNTYLWLIQVAWAFSQHAGWVDGASIPRRERERQRQRQRKKERIARSKLCPF